MQNESGITKKKIRLQLAKGATKWSGIACGLTVAVFILILISSVHIRLSNLPLLVDSTSGEYTSIDYDSLYFYRIAETKIENGGELPESDTLRSPGYDTRWLKEILPDVLVSLHRVQKFFVPSISFNYSATISGPIIYTVVLALFFIFVYATTGSKTGSILASALLGFSPAFLFRSMAGFYDHDHLGLLAVMLFLVILLISFKKLENSWGSTIVWGLCLGFSTALVLVSWGGAITFILVIFPVAAFLYYMMNCQDSGKFLSFCVLWLVSSILFLFLWGHTANSILDELDHVSNQGIAAVFVVAFILLDWLVVKVTRKHPLLNEKYRKLYALGGTAVAGMAGLMILGKNPIALIKKVWATLIYPFHKEFADRFSVTVAEQVQPYLRDLILETGILLFVLFLIGMICATWGVSKSIQNKRHRFYLFGSGLLLFFSVLGSRYSESTVFNGENILSQALFLAGAVTFLGVFIYVHLHGSHQVEINYIVVFAVALTVALNARAAVRSFFLITPFICFLAVFGMVEIRKILLAANHSYFRYVCRFFTVLSIALVSVILFGNPVTKAAGFYQTTSFKAAHTGPAVNSQWQEAMAWVRNNTEENDLFLHWWDYGYLVQTLSGRPTVTDGGHSAGYAAERISRYVLTTPKPATAYSFMKSWDVSYLLIDPRELGKYATFSKMGSDDSWDRIAAGITSGTANPERDGKTSKSKVRTYYIHNCVDESLEYNGAYLPGLSVTEQQRFECRSHLETIIIEQVISGSSVRFKQPVGVYAHGNQQYRIPFKNLFFNGHMISYETGIDAVAYVIPCVNKADEEYRLDQTGAVIYLSPKVQKSLVSRLYVLEDYYNEYAGLNIVHVAHDPWVKKFNTDFEGDLGEFVFYQGELRAPLKIWKPVYPVETETYDQFTDNQHFEGYGGMDSYFKGD